MVLEGWSSFLTTFNTPFRRYRFLCLPLWVVSTDDVFSSCVDNLFKGIPGTYPVVDDLKVQGNMELEDDINVLETYETAYRSGLRFNPSKVRDRSAHTHTSCGPMNYVGMGIAQLDGYAMPVATTYYSTYIWMTCIMDQISVAILEAPTLIFHCHCYPSNLICDGSHNMTSHEISDWCKAKDINRIMCSPYNAA